MYASWTASSPIIMSPKALKRRLSNTQDLVDHKLIDQSDFERVQQTEREFAIGVSDHLSQTMINNPQSLALRNQYIPQDAELHITADELSDPIGDKTHEPVKGIVHRYPDRVLLKIANACAVYCRYCFRREMIGPNSDVLSKDERKKALNYIANTPEIWEVILTGGDPLILSPRQLKDTFEELNNIPHVRAVRIHTRIPIADPKRMSAELLESLETLQDKALNIVLHINHADEITADVKHTIKQLNTLNCTLLSQSVLLKNVNDNADCLENLFRELIAINIKPYYLHHPDKAKGTSHFRLPLKRGMAIYQSLLGRLSGIALPAYMLDIPGGYGKVPINNSYVEELSEGRYTIRDINGQLHEYKDDE